MEPSPLRLYRATQDDYQAIAGLIDEAAEWLRTKDTDQWAQPWPSLQDHRQRILRDLGAGKTFVASQRGTCVATITADADNPSWPPQARRTRAVYACRLVVRRSHAGLGIGAALLDWAGVQARRSDGAAWIRVDVWTTNQALHAYYQRHGFEFFSFAGEPDGYPSAALFQKATIGLAVPDQLRFAPGA